MIPRYSRPDMTHIWSEPHKYKIQFEIEAHAATAMGKLGTIPAEAAETIWANAPTEFTEKDVAAINDIDAKVKHDTIAFLTHVASLVGPEARFLHQGMTSSDVLDTCLAVQLKESAELLEADLSALLATLKKRAQEHKHTVTIGRSHGVHGEPTTFGLKLATFYAEFDRHLGRLAAAKEDVATCAISGAVGTFANVDPEVEAYVAGQLGLTPEPVSTQVINRDRHAFFFGVIGGIASSIERLAVEIRHLQRTEVREASEFFDKGQKGSSAMPHKKNPILTENLTGLARVVRAAVIPVMENVALWHERDISHSSVERTLVPDSLIALDFALSRLTGVMDRLLVYPENMEKNMGLLNGLVFSQRVLLALTQAGVAREEAYEIVQRNALKVWDEGGQFIDYLKSENAVMAHLSEDQLAALFDVDYHLKHVDTIFNRVFGG